MGRIFEKRKHKIFARNAKHCDGAVKRQTLPEALEWLWKDDALPDAKR